MYVQLAIAAAIAFASFTAGWQVNGWRHDAAQVESEKELRQMNAKRESRTGEVAKMYEQKREKAKTVVITQIKEVDRYVKVSDCPLSGGFRVFHDAAASGEVPDPAGIANAPAVTTREAATTIAGNYGSCREAIDRLEALQQWVRDQQNLK